MIGRRCEFSELAETDLTEIALYIATEIPQAALRFVNELRRHCRTLTDHPARNRVREEYGSDVRVATKSAALA